MGPAPDAAGSNGLAPQPTRRPFPSPEWAWPRGPRELLIIAAACANEARAATALWRWLETTDFDAVTFADQRLLVRAADRFPASRLAIHERGRIDGIVRMLWSKSRLALKGAEPVLRALSEAGVPMLVIKGAAQSALDMASLKGRIAHDIDIVIHPDDYPRVLDELETAGWRPDHGASFLYLKALGTRFHGMNFLKPPAGDIDIHSRICRTVSHTHPAETGIWERARATSFMGARVLVPAPTDLFTIAIAHGAVDAQHHCDWIVDCTRLIGEGRIDWPLFLKTIRSLDMLPHAAIALGYMDKALDAAIPADVLADVRHEARASRLTYLEALFLFRARDTHSIISGLARRVFKQRHLGRIRAVNVADTDGTSRRTRKMRRTRATGLDFGGAEPALVRRLPLRAGHLRFRLAVDFGSVGLARRHMLEINTSDRHLFRLKFRDMAGRGRAVATATITLPDDIDPTDVWVESRPAGPLSVRPSPEDQRTFGAMPFRIAVA